MMRTMMKKKKTKKKKTKKKKTKKKKSMRRTLPPSRSIILRSRTAAYISACWVDPHLAPASREPLPPWLPPPAAYAVCALCPPPPILGRDKRIWWDPLIKVREWELIWTLVAL
uniref:Uncharacterized protein n=1 Tax=Ananas comosus var. bracteatus TaxID=296719 RepID=A0A6V7PUC4_ANACO|nr:unnamed protein product [Ananas comosus var. bracteatus]